MNKGVFFEGIQDSHFPTKRGYFGTHLRECGGKEVFFMSCFIMKGGFIWDEKSLFYHKKGGSFWTEKSVFYREKGVVFSWRVSVLPQKRGSFSNWRTRMGTICSSEWGSRDLLCLIKNNYYCCGVLYRHSYSSKLHHQVICRWLHSAQTNKYGNRQHYSSTRFEHSSSRVREMANVLQPTEVLSSDFHQEEENLSSLLDVWSRTRPHTLGWSLQVIWAGDLTYRR